MNVDLVCSTVEIGGRWFPAVTLVCPYHPDYPANRTEFDRHLGTVERFVNRAGIESPLHVYVPMENGTVLSVAEFGKPKPGIVDLYWYDPTYTIEDTTEHGEAFWLPAELEHWFGAEEEWAAEHLPRVARRARPPRRAGKFGPACRRVGLMTARTLQYQLDPEEK